ncbi:MAG: SDR family oxidoreductase [Acidobacteriota bacterium]
MRPSDPAKNAETVLLTGGGGRLGSELRGLMPDIIAPTRSELDICRPDTIRAVLDRCPVTVVVHAAAYTNVTGAEREPRACWETNVGGTRNLVAVLLERRIDLIHISTDYVFYGDRGNYDEESSVGPVRNIYALSKLVSEEIARMAPNHLVIRTSFRPRQWPYPVAFSDLFTSQDYVDVIAPEIALAIRRRRDIPHGTIHIATERKSVFELARRRKPDVVAGSRLSSAVELPEDVSLDTTRWKHLKRRWEEDSGDRP